MAAITVPPTIGTPLAPIPSQASLPTNSLPSSTSSIPKPHKVAFEPELPYPSPSVEDISGFPRINTGCASEPSEDDSENDVAAFPYPNSSQVRSPSPRGRSEDPFASQRGGDGTEGNPFRFRTRNRSEDGDEVEDEAPGPERACGKQNMNLSDEDDASMVSPSSSRVRGTQDRRKLTTPSSRNSHDAKSPEVDTKRHSGFVEKGWARMTGRSSKSDRD